MFDEKRNLYEALTRYNYFPNQKSSIGELPPCLDTRQFTPEVCEALVKATDTTRKKGDGYDVVEYKATRYNNVPRILSLIHPQAHAMLVKHMHDNWDKLKYIKDNNASIIKPEQHDDGRIMVMNYEDAINKTTRIHKESFSKKIRVHADIATCFNSIYSHAIPWALVGFKEAKANRDSKTWFNQLDEFQRKTKRNETQGIPIGPATSSVVVEIILGRVDKELEKNKFKHHRYVDDYTCYCNSSEEAERFLLILGQELSKYKLTLNVKKTEIVELPSSSDDDWILELLGALPSRMQRGGEDEPKLTTTEAMTFINRAILINKVTPDGSVLKYAIQLIMGFLGGGVPYQILNTVLNLSWHFPILIPYIEQLVTLADVDVSGFQEQLEAILIENTRLHRSDGICWPLYILKKHNVKPSEEVIQAVIKNGDCVSLSILHSMIDDPAKIVEFVKPIIAGGEYEKDAFWLLLYQLFQNGDIRNPYGSQVFKILKSFNVNFIPGEVITKAEKKCEEIQNEYVRGIFEFFPALPVAAPVLIETKSEKLPF
jgi:hypothetical protein